MNYKQRQTQIFKALSDETRLRIVNLLQAGSLCVCELVDALEIPQYKISRHLIILKYAGLVDCEREGTWAHYFLRKDDPELKCLFRFLKKFARSLPSGFKQKRPQDLQDAVAAT